MDLKFSMQLMTFMWQFGIVDTFTMFNFLGNIGVQYGAHVAANLAIENSTFVNIISSLFIGLYRGVKFVQYGGADKYKRIAMLSTYLSSSGAALGCKSREVNIAAGANSAAFSQFMRECIESDVNKLKLSQVFQNSTTTNFTSLRGGSSTFDGIFELIDLNLYKYDRKFLMLFEGVKDDSLYKAIDFLHNQNLKLAHSNNYPHTVQTSFYKSISNYPSNYTYKKSIFDIHRKPNKSVRLSASDLEMDLWLAGDDIELKYVNDNVNYLKLIWDHKYKISGILILSGTLFFVYKKSERVQNVCKFINNNYQSIKNHKLINNPVSLRIGILVHSILFVKPL